MLALLRAGGKESFYFHLLPEGDWRFQKNVSPSSRHSFFTRDEGTLIV